MLADGFTIADGELGLADQLLLATTDKLVAVLADGFVITERLVADGFN